MNGNHINTSLNSPASGLAVSFDSLKDLSFRHLSRGCVILIPGLGGRTLNLVGVPIEHVGNEAKTQPWWSDAAFAAGVLELDCDLLRLRVDEVDNSL